MKGVRTMHLLRTAITAITRMYAATVSLDANHLVFGIRNSANRKRVQHKRGAANLARSPVVLTNSGRNRIEGDEFPCYSGLLYSGLVMTPQAMRGGAPLDGPPETA
jgi:hypothetical protein